MDIIVIVIVVVMAVMTASGARKRYSRIEVATGSDISNTRWATSNALQRRYERMVDYALRRNAVNPMYRFSDEAAGSDIVIDSDVQRHLDVLGQIGEMQDMRDAYGHYYMANLEYVRYNGAWMFPGDVPMHKLSASNRNLVQSAMYRNETFMIYGKPVQAEPIYNYDAPMQIGR